MRQILQRGDASRRWRRGFLRPLCTVATILCSIAPGVRAAAGEASSGLSEYERKAALVYHFLQFVKWPDGALPRSGEPLAVCVVGDDPFGPAIDSTLQNKSIGGHPLIVRRFRDPKTASGCHVVFTGRDDLQKVPLTGPGSSVAPILTIGEGEGFSSQGGMIGLVQVAAQIRFTINLEAARRANLQISSKLLSLALPCDGSAIGRR